MFDEGKSLWAAVKSSIGAINTEISDIQTEMALKMGYMNYWDMPQSEVAALLSDPNFSRPYIVVANLWETGVWGSVVHKPPRADVDMYTVYVSQFGSGVSQVWIGSGRMYSIVTAGQQWDESGWFAPPTQADMLNKANKNEAMCYLNHWGTIQARAVEMLSNPGFTRPFIITANLWDSVWAGVAHLPPNAPGDMYTVYVAQCGGGVSQLWVSGGRIYSIASDGTNWHNWVGPIATATLPEEHYLPLSEGVSAIQKNYYLKRQDSCVEVRFSVSFPPTDGRIKVIAALPAGYLPGNTEADSCTAIEAVGDVMGAAKVEVLSNGVVQIYANAAGAIGAAGSIVFTATH